jgi:proteasome assembly chaperone (PAC2) family protein
MTPDRLEMQTRPELHDGRMVLAFSGWMDGGDVSTGTVEWLAATLNAPRVAQIGPEGFYIYNFPGPMEISALFRPHTRIEEGVIRVFQPPENAFFCDQDNELILFRGKEPNFNWSAFADCIFSFAAQAGVSVMYFVGSVGGTVPHTREPRLISTVSDERLKPSLQQYGVRFTDYEGPASFSTHLLAQARSRGLGMASLVAEIPAYVQGPNPKSIEAVVRKLAAILRLEVDPGELRTLSTAWEERLNEALEQKQDLAGHIRKLEEDYDNEVFDTQMGDLKEWLQQQGIRLE